MRSSRAVALIVVVLAGASLVAAGEVGSSRWTVDDVVKGESARDWAVSPDGTRAVWVKSTVEKVEGVEKRVERLWMTRLADGESVQLTRGDDSASAPAFSPDGATVAFLFSR